MERARTEWLRNMGFEQTALKDELGVIIVIHSLAIAFKSPARFNDLLEVQCKLAKFGHSRMGIEQIISRDGATLAEAQVIGVFVDAHTFKPVSIPISIKQAMEKL